MKQEKRKNWFMKNKITTVMLGSVFSFLYFVYLMTKSFDKLATAEKTTKVNTLANEVSQSLPFFQVSIILLVIAIIMKVVKTCNNKAEAEVQEVAE